jgi:hypothetical protein
MPASDTDKALQLLAHALADVSAAIALLQPSGLQLPPGVEPADGHCAHPKWRKTFGGRGYCPDCGASK